MHRDALFFITFVAIGYGIMGVRTEATITGGALFIRQDWVDLSRLAHFWGVRSVGCFSAPQSSSFRF